MEFFLDTANLKEIDEAGKRGLLDGVTTNPSLLAREGGDWRAQMRSVCELAGDLPVSLEVVGETSGAMLAEAGELTGFGSNVVIKLPMTSEGLVACKGLTQKGVRTNMTLVFSPMQALLAAKAGATYVSPFVGRLDAIGQDGMELIEQVRTIFDNYDFSTKILVASIRSPMHVLQSALLGADVATIPFSVMEQLVKHPLTDSGLAAFLKDWESVAG